MTKTQNTKKPLTTCGSYMHFVWDLFEDTEGSKVSSYINFWIMFLIVCSAIVAVVETIPSIHKSQEELWFWLETIFVFFFTVEFVGRVISCPSKFVFATTVCDLCATGACHCPPQLAPLTIVACASFYTILHSYVASTYLRHSHLSTRCQLDAMCHDSRSCLDTAPQTLTPALCRQLMNYIDLVAILPYYMDIISMLLSTGGDPPNFGFLRILRLSRAARLIKLSKYSQGIRLVTNAMANSVDALQLFALLLVTPPLAQTLS